MHRFSLIKKYSGILGPFNGLLLAFGAAAILIIQVTLRPWAGPDYAADTHLNTTGYEEGYTRSEIAYVGQTDDGPDGWVPSEFALASASEGYAAFVGYGCASCHGTDAKGTAAGPPVAGSSLRRIGNLTRQGPKTMPAYGEGHLTDANLDLISAYLTSLEEVAATPEPQVRPTATPFPLPTPTPAPTVSPTETPVPGASPTPTPPAPTATPTRAPVDTARLNAAKILFLDVGCDICHGELAQGKDSSGPALEDLTAEDIRAFVRDPQRPADSPYSEEMDPYDQSDLSDQELEELIYFLLNRDQ